jgi:hypothetical protein
MEELKEFRETWRGGSRRIQVLFLDFWGHEMDDSSILTWETGKRRVWRQVGIL